MVTTQKVGIPLQEWADAHQPSENMIYYNDYWNQIVFVRDKVPNLLAKSYQEFKDIQATIEVISHHSSKSVCLPVFQVTSPGGTTFTMRCNFHDWKVSVHSPRVVEIDFKHLFNPHTKIHKTSCEGFPQDLVYGQYAENKSQFTIELPPDNHYLFVFFWLFADQVLVYENESRN